MQEPEGENEKPRISVKSIAVAPREDTNVGVDEARSGKIRNPSSEQASRKRLKSPSLALGLVLEM
jgi:hypothetical protein